jgi:hypothetical protein
MAGALIRSRLVTALGAGCSTPSNTQVQVIELELIPDYIVPRGAAYSNPIARAVVVVRVRVKGLHVRVTVTIPRAMEGNSVY